MAKTEDIPYNVSEFATPEDEKQSDVDQPNKSVLLEVQNYLEEAIAEHNSLDVVNPEAETTMTTQQQVTVHKQVVIELRSVKAIIDNKIKELI